MIATIDSVILALENFSPDPENLGNDALLYEVLDGFESLPDREKAIVTLFEVMERFPQADLGSPGPLVHELEAIPGYEPYLRESLHRCPTDLSVWMVNRILNSHLPQESRAMWIGELRMVLRHPKALESASGSAKEFLEYQNA